MMPCSSAQAANVRILTGSGLAPEGPIKPETNREVARALGLAIGTFNKPDAHAGGVLEVVVTRTAADAMTGRLRGGAGTAGAW